MKSLDDDILLKFRNDLQKAIKKQILHLTTVDKIASITQRVEKADPNVLIGVSLIWLVLPDILDQEDDLIPFYYWAGEKGGQAALDKMVPDYIFQLDNLKLKTQLSERASFLMRTIDKTTQKIVAGTIAEGIRQNLNNHAMVQYLKQDADKISRERAELISETELAYSMGLVEVEALRRNGIEMHKWVTEKSELTCEKCIANEEVGYIGVGEEFPSGVMAVPEHPQCRCYLLPKLPLAINGEIWTGK